MAESPEMNYLPVNEVWGWNADIIDDPDELAEVPRHGLRTNQNEYVPRVISAMKRSISVELALRFRRPVVPLHPRMRRLIGASHTADDAEVAKCLAALLGLRDPTTEASQELLVLMAIFAQGWYDDPWAPYDETELGSEIAGRIASIMPGPDFLAALDQLGIEDYEWLWPVADTLVLDKMGFERL